MFRSFAAAAAFAVALPLLATPAPVAAQHAGAASHGPISIEGGFARAAAMSGGASAAYMTIATTGEADRLIAASSPAARRVELHTHLLEDGVARMREVEAIDLAPGAPAVLEPGGLHVMLMGLDAALAEGDALDLTLTFEKAGDVSVSVPVRALTGGGMTHGGHGN